jgi:hypothetical protein
MFVILGRDPIGAGLVRLWAAARPALEKAGDDAKIAEAIACADDMQAYCQNYNRQPYDALACLPFNMLADELRRRGATITNAPHGGDFEKSVNGVSSQSMELDFKEWAEILASILRATRPHVEASKLPGSNVPTLLSNLDGILESFATDAAKSGNSQVNSEKP